MFKEYLRAQYMQKMQDEEGGEMPRQERSPKWGGTDRKGVAISWAGLT